MQSQSAHEKESFAVDTGAGNLWCLEDGCPQYSHGSEGIAEAVTEPQ